MALKTSARNQLPGVITAIKLGEVMAQVNVQVGDNHVVSAITRDSVEDLGLKVGDAVLVVIKSTEVMIARDDQSE